MKYKYIVQLEKEVQNKIKKELILFYKEELELNKQERENELEKAMNSRLIDLEETIRIDIY